MTPRTGGRKLCGADELVFYDITASFEERTIFTDILKKTAERVFIPLTVGGGINTLDDFARVLACGADITEDSADKRSLAGIFLSYQAPVEVPGVPLYSYLRTITQKRPELKMTARKFRARVGEIAEQLDMDSSFITRELNVGFSGGEKKKIEMLQLLLLQPKLAILDETDSGLDVDALSVVSRGIEAYRASCDGALLIITHNTRILERLSVDHTHVMVRGRLVAEGPGSLIDDIDAHGFEQFEVAAQAAGA